MIESWVLPLGFLISSLGNLHFSFSACLLFKIVFLSSVWYGGIACDVAQIPTYFNIETVNNKAYLQLQAEYGKIVT